MDLKDVCELATTVAVVAATVWELALLVRTPRDRALRVLVVGLVLLSFTLTAGLPLPYFEAIGHWQDQPPLYIGNIIWMTMAWAYAAFFLLADRDRDPQLCRRLVQRTLTGLVVCIGLEYLAVLTWSGPTGTPTYWRSWQNFVFVLSCYGYSLTVYVIGGAWAASYLRRLSHRWMRAAVTLVIVGAGGMTVGVDLLTLVQSLLLRPILSTSSPYSWLKVFYNIGRLGGQSVLAVGLILVPVATVLYLLQSRRDERFRHVESRQIEPLWRRITAEMPFVVLESDQLGGTFERQTAEVSDGISRLAMYVPVENRHSGEPTAAGTAAMVEAALRARARAQETSGNSENAWGEGPYPRMEPNFGARWKVRARWMGEVSRTLTERGVLDVKHRASEEVSP